MTLDHNPRKDLGGFQAISVANNYRLWTPIRAKVAHVPDQGSFENVQSRLPVLQPTDVDG